MSHLGYTAITDQKVCFCLLVTHWLGIVVHTCDLITQKADKRGSRIQGQPRLDSETPISKNKENIF